VNGEIWYAKYYPAPGAPQKRVPLGRTADMTEKQARTALDDIVAVLNRRHSQALGSELVRRFVEQMYIPQKYENGEWREASGQDAEYLFRRFICPSIGDSRCRDLKAEDLRTILRDLANAGRMYEEIKKVRLAMKDMIRKMVAEGYLQVNIAADLKTPKFAKRSDRSRLRRVSLQEYSRAWTILDEQERLAFDLVLFCGLRESEAYGLRVGDLIKKGTIRIERSWYRGNIEPPKNGRIRLVGIDFEIFGRLERRIENLPEHLGGHLKTGQSGTLQKRPVERVQDSHSFTSPVILSARVFQIASSFGARFGLY
jgi:integrase